MPVNKATEPLHVVVGVIRNSQGKILIAKRPSHMHQGGLWEFPGGKLEGTESPEQALSRELFEEISIQPGSFFPLRKIQHDYPDKSVLLDVYLINAYKGVAHGREGQEIQWVDTQQLMNFDFPAANLEIIKMLELPEKCLITGTFTTASEFLENLKASLERGVRLVQLRLKGVDKDLQLELAAKSFELCQKYHALLLLNPSLGNEHGLDVAGLHLTSRQLFEFKTRPIEKNKLLSASVHDQSELDQAKVLEADFVLLSPVLPTTSHPDTEPLGWDKFNTLAAKATCPVYALGGIDESHITKAKECGAQGIAAISALWGQKK